MANTVDETVGPAFQADLLTHARNQTLALITEIAARIRPGMREAEAHALLKELQPLRGAAKAWHSPQIRFGKNTLRAYGEPADPEVVLQENDIFFLDIGPIFDGHEGDVGRAFTVGNDPEMQRCCGDIDEIWHEVRAHWEKEKATGQELYTFAAACAARRGWRLTLEHASGHRIADFPHTAKARGSIEAFPGHPVSDRWILEIQIRHPSRDFGAFYEDLLR